MSKKATLEELEMALDGVCVARSLHPDDREMNFWEAAGVSGDGTLEAARGNLALLRQSVELGTVPIAAVYGTKNSGKSTIVRLFLSDKGRSRVLVGSLGKEGTHRFVFWLPESWRADGRAEQARDMIEAACGERPVLLPEDSQAAHEEYNARRRGARDFGIPLVGFDSALDAEGIGLLDCPDIECPLDPSAQGRTSHLRQAALEKLVRTCSAFCLVTTQERQESEALDTLVDVLQQHAPGMRFYYILNKAYRGNPVEEIVGDIDRRLKKWEHAELIRRSYFAYFDEAVHTNAKPPEPTPTRDGDPGFHEIRRELDAGAMQRERIGSRLKAFEAVLREVKERLEGIAASAKSVAADAQEAIIRFLEREYVTDEGEVRVFSPSRSSAEILNSVMRAAPKTVKAAAFLPDQAGKAMKWVGRKFVELKETAIPWTIKTKEVPRDEIKIGRAVSGSDFAHQLLGRKFMLPDVDETTLVGIWDEAVRRVDKFSEDQVMDREVLDEMSQQFWREIPLGKKFKVYLHLLGAAAALAALGFLSQLDGGLVTIPLLHAKLSLGAYEILAILLGAPIGASLTSHPNTQRMKADVQSRIAAPQLGALLQGLLDQLFIPYPEDADLRTLKKSRERVVLTLPQLEEKLPVKAFVVKGPILVENEEGVKLIGGIVDELAM